MHRFRTGDLKKRRENVRISNILVRSRNHCCNVKIKYYECVCLGEGRGVHRVLVGKPEGKSPLGRTRRRWEDNIKMDLQEVGGGCGDWMELAQVRDRCRALVNTVRNLRVPKMRGIS